MLLTACGITKRFGAHIVLNDASFSVRPGEILGLIGPNGSGKTTLFECLVSLLPPESGTVEPPGKDVLFYLPDAIRPWPQQRVGRILNFFAALHGKTASDAAAVAASLTLTPLLDARIAGLSKGELKRTLLALGLLAPHRLLLFDEPFDGLDARQTRDVASLLRTVPASGRTLFLSIHQLNDAARVCHRFILLNRGRVVGQGTFEELRALAGLAEGSLEEVFLALT